MLKIGDDWGIKSAVGLDKDGVKAPNRLLQQLQESFCAKIRKVLVEVLELFTLALDLD